MTQPSSPPHYYHGAKIIRTQAVCQNDRRRLYRIAFPEWEKPAEKRPLITTRRAAQEFIDRQPIKRRKKTVHIYELKAGDSVDLENDLYADRGEHPEFEFEYQRVERVEHETASCFVVHFESGFACGFPPDHQVIVKAG